MNEILIRCPVTRKQLSTGIALKPDAFARMESTNRSVYCPYCRLSHPWNKRDAFLRR